jgi:putative transposase
VAASALARCRNEIRERARPCITSRAAVKETHAAHPFAIDAVVILPDHIHIVMTLPEADADYPTRLSLIKRRFTDAVVKLGAPVARRRNGEIGLWQRRFWEHTIRDEGDRERHVDYVHFNPVKHGLVSRVCDWPYSSFHRYLRRGLLPQDWGGDFAPGQASFGEPHS